MIHIQVVPQADEDLKGMLRAAITEGRIKSFEIARVRGGLRVIHKRYNGRVDLDQKNGILTAKLSCHNRDDEWQLVQAFVGRLIYHFRDHIVTLDIQPK